MHLSAAIAVRPETTLTKLELETRIHHDEADAGWRRLRDDMRASRDDYVRELVTTYGLEAPYEAACAYTPGLGQVIDLRGRWRSGLIAQDLLTLGWVPDEITKIRCAPVTTFQDPAEALGWMYVVERSTLVHDAVRESLVSRFVDLSRATTYLLAYRRHANVRWAELGMALERIAAGTRIEKRIMEAAHHAFRSVLEWRHSTSPTLRSVAG